MCKHAHTKKGKMVLSRLPQACSAFVPTFAGGFLKPPYTLRKTIGLIFLLSLVSFASLYTFHRGFRRTLQFWRGMAPLVAKYKAVKFRARHCSPEELEQRLDKYRDETAPKLVDLILRLGGIYVKVRSKCELVKSVHVHVPSDCQVIDGCVPRAARVSRLVKVRKNMSSLADKRSHTFLSLTVARRSH